MTRFNIFPDAESGVVRIKCNGTTEIDVNQFSDNLSTITTNGVEVTLACRHFEVLQCLTGLFIPLAVTRSKYDKERVYSKR